MSTRRARIKAVAVLPVRKRAAENKTVSENKPNTVEDNNCELKECKSENSFENNTNETTKKQENCINVETDSTEKLKVSEKIDDVSEKEVTKGSNKEASHRRRMMKPSINIVNTNKRNKSSAKNENSKQNVSPLKSPNIRNSPKSTNILSKKNESTPRKSTSIYQNSILLSPKNNMDSDKNNIVPIEGIIPLTPQNILDNSKSSIRNNTVDISSTECNFDPIIPIPSAKNRPKLKPTPRFAIRRNSCQGSASESEDDVRKIRRDEPILVSNNTPQTPVVPITVNRFRNDSICSLPSDSHLHVNLPMTPRQKIHRSRQTGSETRRALAKKKALNKLPQNTLTMCDLIYYNPPLYNKKLGNSVIKEEKDAILKMEQKYPIEKKEIRESIEQEPSCVAVPQVKLGPNGEIVVDEQSLVIETTDTIKSRNEISKLSIVYETGNISGGGLYRRTSRSREWSNAETLRFYKALNTIGTDFALMISLFPGRTRKDLKMKFKKEEKQNMALIEKALMKPLNFDISELEAELLEEQRAIKQKRIELQKSREPKNKSKIVTRYRKSSLALRSMEENSDVDDPITKKSILRSKLEEKTKSQNDPLKTNEAILENNVDENEVSNMESVPQNMEPGTMIVIVKKIAGEPNHNTLQAYTSQLVGNDIEMIPISLELDILKSIASEMNILKEGQEYRLADDETPMETDLNRSVDLNSDVLMNTDAIEIDDAILNDSTIDNYILNGDVPNIINL